MFFNKMLKRNNAAMTGEHQAMTTRSRDRELRVCVCVCVAYLVGLLEALAVNTWRGSPLISTEAAVTSTRPSLYLQHNTRHNVNHGAFPRQPRRKQANTKLSQNS